MRSLASAGGPRSSIGGKGTAGGLAGLPDCGNGEASGACEAGGAVAPASSPLPLGFSASHRSQQAGRRNRRRTIADDSASAAKRMAKPSNNTRPKRRFRIETFLKGRRSRRSRIDRIPLEGSSRPASRQMFQGAPNAREAPFPSKDRLGRNSWVARVSSSLSSLFARSLGLAAHWATNMATNWAANWAVHRGGVRSPIAFG